MSALDTYFIAAPILGEIIKNFQNYSGINSIESKSIHHESFGGKGCKIMSATTKLSSALVKELNLFKAFKFKALGLRPILVHFISKRTRDSSFWNQKKLRDADPEGASSIYMNELLTKQTAN